MFAFFCGAVFGIALTCALMYWMDRDDRDAAENDRRILETSFPVYGECEDGPEGDATADFAPDKTQPVEGFRAHYQFGQRIPCTGDACPVCAEMPTAIYSFPPAAAAPNGDYDQWRAQREHTKAAAE